MPTFKKSHIIEAAVVIVMVSVIAVFSIPRFLSSQHRQQWKSVQDTIDAVYQLCIDDPLMAETIGKRAGIESAMFSGPTTFREGEMIPLYFEHKIYSLDLRRLKANFPDLPQPNWIASNLTITLCAVFSKKDANQHTLDAGYEDLPFYFSIHASVGGAPLKFDSRYSIYMDNDGYLTRAVQVTPYHLSNGVTSSGHYFRDSFDEWERKKAVLLTPPQ